MLSIVVVNWNTREHLRRCLAALRAFPPSTDTEWIVVDNASNDASSEMVAAEFPEARLLNMTRNMGYAAGSNEGFAVAGGGQILTLNPDAQVTEGAIDRCLDALACNPWVGAAAARLVSPETGEAQRSVRGFPTLWGLAGYATGVGRLLPGSALDSYGLSDFDYGRTQVAPQPMGTFLIYSRRALERVADPLRPFDERFPIFFNEVDLLYRLHQAGHPCLYVAGAEVVHAHGASTSQARNAMVWESHRSLVRYLRKHTRGVGRLALPIVGMVAWVAALARSRGFDAGFRG